MVWLCEFNLSFSLSNADIDDGSFEPTIVAGLGYAGNQAQLMSVPPFAVAFVCTYSKKTIFLMVIRLAKTVSFISAFVSDHYQCRGYTTIFFSLLEVIGFTMFYGMLKPFSRRGCLTVPKYSKHIEPRPLRVPFPLHPWGILWGALIDYVVGEQQRTAHPTCNRCGHVLHRYPTRRYTCHLAPWIAVSRPQLHISDDHFHRHVNRHGGPLNCQLGVPRARKPFESGEEAEEEEGRRAGGSWRS